MGSLKTDRIGVEPEQQVVVAVDDSWGDQRATRVQHPRRGRSLGGVTDMGDPAVGHSYGSCPGASIVEGAYSGVGDQEVEHGKSIL